MTGNAHCFAQTYRNSTAGPHANKAWGASLQVTAATSTTQPQQVVKLAYCLPLQLHNCASTTLQSASKTSCSSLGCPLSTLPPL